DLAATLAPAPEDVLTRRADLLDALLAEGCQTDARSQLALVSDAVDQAAQGVLPESNQQFVDLAMALANHSVRDSFLSPDDPDRALAATTLSRCLAQGIPGPDRAEPAVLFAFAACRRGDGVP